MIVVVHPRLLEMLPPLMSLLRILKDRGEKVAYVGLMTSQRTKEILEELRIPYRLYPYRVVALKDAPVERAWQRFGSRIIPYLKRRWLWQQLENLGFNEQEDLLWSIEAQGAALLGDRALSIGRRHIQTFYELGDTVGAHLLGFDLEAMCRSATIVECEYNRAQIFMAEHELNRLPFVVPNKPYSHPRQRYVNIGNDDAAKTVASWKGHRVILYQGGIQGDRGDLLRVIEVLCRNFPQLVVAVMGKETEAVRRLKAQYANFSHVPFVQPPHHLEVTSHADFGLAFYRGGGSPWFSPLNSVYCAPNKIYEYAGYGLPILCNDIPGLRYTVGAFGAGICLSEFSDEEIVRVMNRLLAEYDGFSSGAKRLYEDVDLPKRIGEILGFARGK